MLGQQNSKRKRKIINTDKVQNTGKTTIMTSEPTLLRR